MTDRTGGWRTRISMVRQALARQPKIQKVLDDAIVEIRSESVHDGKDTAVAGLTAFAESLRGRDDVSANDVLDGVLLLAADMKKEKLPNGTPR